MVHSPYRPDTEFHSTERCHIVEIHNSEDDHDASIARARVSPGITTQLHALRGTTERYVILDGEGAVEVNGGPPIEVRALDVVAIPAGVSQRITNTGESDLVFLCVCVPRFRPESYESLEM